MSEPEAHVCGFADEATAIAGLAWILPDAAGGLLVRTGETSPCEARIEVEEGTIDIKLEGEGVGCEAKLSARPGLTALLGLEGEAAPGGAEAASCAATVRLTREGDGRSVDCAGHATRWGRSPLEDAALFRHLAIPAPDGGLILLLARRAPGADDHGAERVEAWLLDAEGQALAFNEALLSTQYDEGGLQTRAGLELWPSETDAPPLRAAGTVQRGTAAVLALVSAAILHSSAEGSEGIGSYLVWRG